MVAGVRVLSLASSGLAAISVAIWVHSGASGGLGLNLVEHGGEAASPNGLMFVQPFHLGLLAVPAQ